MPRVRQYRSGTVVQGADGAAGAAGADGGGTQALHQDAADHATTGTVEELLDSYVLPGGTLANDGERLKIRAWFQCAANNNNKTVTIEFGGTDVYQRTDPGNNDLILVEVDVHRTGAATQRGVGMSFWGDSGWTRKQTTSSPTETLSGNVTISIRGTTPTASGDLTLKSWTVEKIAAPGGTIATAPVAPAALYSDQSDHATAGTAEETLDSYVMPANTLAAAGDGLRISAVFRTAANANTKAAGIDFGATELTTISSSVNNQAYVIEAEVWHKAASSQIAWGGSHREAAIGNFLQTAPAEDETGTITIAIRGTTPTQAGDLTLKAWRVEKITAPSP